MGKHDDAIKAEAIAAVLRGETQRKVAARFGVAPSTVARWLASYRRGEMGLNVVGAGVVADAEGRPPGMASVVPLRPGVTLGRRALAKDGPTPDQAAALLEAAELNPRDATIAQSAGVSLEMLRKWLDIGRRAPDSPLGEFVVELERRAATARLEMLRVLREAAREDWRAAQAVLDKTEFAEGRATSLASDPHAGLRNMLAQLGARAVDEGEEGAG